MSRYVVCIFLLLGSTGAALAQDRGSITGAVTDPTGAVVPGAQVTAKNSRTGLTQSAVTGENGLYTFLYLPVGTYTIVAEMTGFRRAEAAGVVVNVNTTARLDVQLTVGEIDQMVTVTASSP